MNHFVFSVARVQFRIDQGSVDAERPRHCRDDVGRSAREVEPFTDRVSDLVSDAFKSLLAIFRDGGSLCLGFSAPLVGLVVLLGTFFEGSVVLAMLISCPATGRPTAGVSGSSPAAPPLPLSAAPGIRRG